ncbi:MAG: cytochrome-c peroxidase, partial [Saprospiraceae bacterium]|nr:cytochrome-c peroxidase [Saprospiraceae bacterium]
MKIRYLAVIILISSIWACTKDQMPSLIELDQELEDLVSRSSATGDLDFYILPDENDLAAIPQDPKNPLTPAKVELGKLLFYETGFAMDAMKESGQGTYSCAS